MKHLGQLSISEWREEQEKYHSIDNYLQEQIASLPLEPVFAENFSFKDIYVPQKEKPIDANGKLKNDAEAFDLQTWAKQLLEDESKQHRVMFVEAGLLDAVKAFFVGCLLTGCDKIFIQFGRPC